MSDSSEETTSLDFSSEDVEDYDDFEPVEGNHDKLIMA